MGQWIGSALALTLLVVAPAAAPTGSSPTAASAAAAPRGRIAYAPRVYPKDQRIGDNWEIYAVSAAGGKSVNLTRSGGCHDGDPAWSNDGQWIAFRCLRGLRASVVIMSRDRRAQRTIVRFRTPQVYDLAWSPDDRQLAFAGGGIKVVGADGTGLRRLTRGRDASPTWSPDGRTIVFSRASRGVLQMRADGTGLRQIASRAREPALSPDGRTIAFLRGAGSIWLMGADGGRQRQLRRARDGHVELAWSPDGRWLAYQHQHYEIYVIAADGANPRLLPTYGADFGGMDWGPALTR